MNVMESPDGRGWRPAVPLPYLLLFGRCRCTCGKKFRNRAKYEQHYREDHLP